MAENSDSADKRTERTVVIAGVEHTLLLTDEDAERLGAEDAKSKTAAPANKSRTASDK